MTMREQHISDLIGDDAERLGRLQEIDSWFSTAKGLNKGSYRVRVRMTYDELMECFPNFESQPVMKVLLWAMMAADSPDLEQRHKWRVFRSMRYRQALSPMAPMVVVMGLPASGTKEAPIEVVDEEEEVPWRRARGEEDHGSAPTLFSPLLVVGNMP